MSKSIKIEFDDDAFLSLQNSLWLRLMTQGGITSDLELFVKLIVEAVQNREKTLKIIHK